MQVHKDRENKICLTDSSENLPAMHQARLTVTSEPTVYRAITRTSRGEFLFGEVEKNMMRRMLWQMADFCS